MILFHIEGLLGSNLKRGTTHVLRCVMYRIKLNVRRTPSFLLGYLGKKKAENLENVRTLLKFQRDRYKAKNGK